MKIYILLTLSLLIVATSCNNGSESEQRKQKENCTTLKDTDVQNKNEVRTISNSTKSDNDTVQENYYKGIEKTTDNPKDVYIDVIQTIEDNDIIPGYTKNEFIKDGNNTHFKRIVKNDEDKSVGCSGGGTEMSFTVVNPTDTFLIENENLKTIDFKLNIHGGLYWEQGKDPHKGKIIGILLPEGTWQIEINIWIITTNTPFDEKIERQISLTEIFY